MVAQEQLSHGEVDVEEVEALAIDLLEGGVLGEAIGPEIIGDDFRFVVVEVLEERAVPLAEALARGQLLHLAEHWRAETFDANGLAFDLVVGVADGCGIGAGERDGGYFVAERLEAANVVDDKRLAGAGEGIDDVADTHGGLVDSR